MLGSSTGGNGPGAVPRVLWPLAPAAAPPPPSPGAGDRYGVYSLFPGAGSPAPGVGAALYQQHCSSVGRMQQPTTATVTAFHQPPAAHQQHKVADSLFSPGYTFAPTPPPGSPFSPSLSIPPLALTPTGDLLLKAPEGKKCPTPAVTSTESPNEGGRWYEERCCVKRCEGGNKIKVDKKMGGCSRTQPVKWGVCVKREPGVTPCQVAEVTTSDVESATGTVAVASPVVKLEAAETTPTPASSTTHHKTEIHLSQTLTNGNIPVGIAVARQRLQQDTTMSCTATATPELHFSTAPTLAAGPAITTTHHLLKEVSRITDIDCTSMAASTAAGGGTVGGAMGGAMGGTLLQCGDERTPLAAAWPVGAGSHHAPALATPTLWQYPEPIMPFPLPMPPVGFQLVRDPSSGHFLLIPTASIEQAMVWPSYSQPSSHVLLPPLPPPPLAPLQLLSSTPTDYLATSTTLHQHTQTHSTRLVALTTSDNKRKVPLPLSGHTLIKIEADCTATSTLDQKAVQQTVSTVSSNSGTVFTDNSVTPLLTTHVFYQHPANLILSSAQSTETSCKSQATSPVTCLTPPPETAVEEEVGVQDASNQTELLEEEEEKLKIEVKKTSELLEVPEEDKENKPDISGLELLSNSIVEYEKMDVKYEKEPKETQSEEVVNGIATMTIKDNEYSKNLDDNLGGLNLLCALAEQRFVEEVLEKQNEEDYKHYKQYKKPKNHDRKEVSKSFFEPENTELDLEKEKLTVFKKVTVEKAKEKCAIEKKTDKEDKFGCEENDDYVSAEMKMRRKLEDLERQCKQKELELSKLLPECGDCSKRQKQTPSPPLLDKMDETPTTPIRQSPELLKPPILCPITPETKPEDKPDLKRKSETPEKISSSKKRKVGRPKKLITPNLKVQTETIVAKKPRKNGIVGFLLAAKNRLQMQTKNGLAHSKSPPRYVEESPKKVKVKTQKKIAKSCEFKKKKHRSKIRPKLKAEPKIKKIQEEEECSEWEVTMPVEEDLPVPEEPEPEEPISTQNLRCTLTSEHLDTDCDKMRVLTAMGGLFYAGQLSAIQPPDVYAITLDGERGNRPHIMSREEILRDAIVEVSPASTSELLPGTRMCAYWSQQYRCLYPGTVAEPGTPDPLLDLKFVCVEFDDGDSGRIALEDIRLLPTDYPIIEYDPNPLLSLSKRRRRTSVNSTTEERRFIQSNPVQTNPVPETPKLSNIAEKENTDSNKQDFDYKERKKLKKRRKDKLKKLLFKDDKNKKRKHRCCDEHCKHRKHHKKHKKHRKHHHRSENVDSVVEKETVNELEEIEEPEEEVNGNIIEETNIIHTKILESKAKKAKKGRERQESVESRSKMAAFLPARQLWGWSGKGYKRVGIRGRARKQFFKAIQRGKECIMVGDCAVFLSTGRPDRPYIGRIEAMWESWGTNMVVKVKWFYHPEETVGCPQNLQYPGALFESPHIDENDVQTISHKCEVLPLKEYTSKLGDDPHCYDTIYENNDIYYLAGYYDPTTTTLTMEPGIPVTDA